MNGCSLGFKTKAVLAERIENLKNLYDTAISQHFGPFNQALDSLQSDLPELKISEALNKVKEQMERVGSNVASATFWMVTQILQKSKAVLRKAVTAYALRRLQQDLENRIDVYQNLRVQFNVIQTSLRIINANLSPVSNNPTLLNRLHRATNHTREALIRSRQIAAIWQSSGYYNDALFKIMEQELQKAQNNLILPEIQTYQDALRDHLSDIDSRILDGSLEELINVDSLLDIAASEAFNPSSLSGRAAIALEPLFRLIQGESNDEIARVLMAYNLMMQASVQIMKLTVGLNDSVSEVLSETGRSLAVSSNLPAGGSLFPDKDYFTRFGKEYDYNLLKQNSVVLYKIRALKNIGNKWEVFDNITAPFVNYIDDATVELSDVYRDMRETLAEANNNSTLYSKANEWSSKISDVQVKLTPIAPVANEAVGDLTSWQKAWASVIDYIDLYDVESDIGATIFYQIMSTITSLPAAVTSSDGAISGITKIEVIKKNIDRGNSNDQNLKLMIEALNLDEVEGLDDVDKIVDNCEEVFPILAEIIRNADVEKLNLAIQNIKSSYTSSFSDIKKSFRKVGSSLKSVYEGEMNQEAVQCAESLGVDINLKFSLGGAGDEESEEEMKAIANFYSKKVSDIRSILDLDTDGIDLPNSGQ